MVARMSPTARRRARTSPGRGGRCRLAGPHVAAPPTHPARRWPRWTIRRVPPLATRRRWACRLARSRVARSTGEIVWPRRHPFASGPVPPLPRVVAGGAVGADGPPPAPPLPAPLQAAPTPPPPPATMTRSARLVPPTRTSEAPPPPPVPSVPRPPDAAAVEAAFAGRGHAVGEATSAADVDRDGLAGGHRDRWPGPGRPCPRCRRIRRRCCRRPGPRRGRRWPG